MANLTPIFASEPTSARLLDMSVADFQRLVTEGSLPPATRLDSWDVEKIRHIRRGDAAKYGRKLDL